MVEDGITTFRGKWNVPFGQAQLMRGSARTRLAPALYERLGKSGEQLRGAKAREGRNVFGRKTPATAGLRRASTASASLWIDDADSRAGRKPYLSVSGLRWARHRDAGNYPDSIRAVESRSDDGFARRRPMHPDPAGPSVAGRIRCTTRRNGRHPPSLT